MVPSHPVPSSTHSAEIRRSLGGKSTQLLTETLALPKPAQKCPRCRPLIKTSSLPKGCKDLFLPAELSCRHSRAAGLAQGQRVASQRVPPPRLRLPGSSGPSGGARRILGMSLKSCEPCWLFPQRPPRGRAVFTAPRGLLGSFRHSTSPSLPVWAYENNCSPGLVQWLPPENEQNVVVGEASKSKTMEERDEPAGRLQEEKNQHGCPKKSSRSSPAAPPKSWKWS
ncbi:uncharacterized protein RHO17_003794 [Thomomys bottae]